MKAKSSGNEGRFAYEGLDRVIHERARLSVLTSLITHPKGVSFGDLKQLCSLTDGNLNRHLRVLEEAGMVSIAKGDSIATGRRRSAELRRRDRNGIWNTWRRWSRWCGMRPRGAQEAGKRGLLTGLAASKA